MFWLTYVHGTVPLSNWIKDARYTAFSPPVATEEQVISFQPEDDHVTRVCKLSMYLKWAEELHSGIILTPLTTGLVTLPPAQRVEAYVRTCREFYERLPEDGEQRRVLEALHPVPRPWQFHLNVTHPWMNGPYTETMWNGADVTMQQAPGVSRPQGTEVLWEEERTARANALPSIKTRLKPQEELRRTLPEFIWKGLEDLGLTPVRDEWVEAKDIPEALVNGKTVVFDATKLCGKEVFNLTVPDIARLHGEMAHSIPAFKLNSAGFGDSTFDTLAELANRFDTWNKRGWQHYPEFGPFWTQQEVDQKNRANMPTDGFMKLIEWAQARLEKVHPMMIVYRHLASVNQYRQMNSQTTINVKRLPKFPLKDMREVMGNPSWLDRLWSLLWIGPVGDFWHFDEEDNLLICVSGNIYVAVMEQNVTEIVANTRNVGVGWNNLMGFFRNRDGSRAWIDDNDWMRKMPLHFLKLEPGMGITVPSKTYHNVMALDGNRILMNCFFLPKYKALEKVPAAPNSWWKAGTQADTYRALWHLKASIVGHLWDTMKMGGFFAGYKLEFF